MMIHFMNQFTNPFKMQTTPHIQLNCYHHQINIHHLLQIIVINIEVLTKHPAVFHQLDLIQKYIITILIFISFTNLIFLILISSTQFLA